MKLSRVQFTVRLLMAAVAVGALVLAVADQLRRRRESFQQRAEVYRRKTGDADVAAQVTRSGNQFVWDPRTSPAYQELSDYYDALRVKYERAAAHPWRPVMPDPPEPAWPEGVPKGLRGRGDSFGIASGQPIRSFSQTKVFEKAEHLPPKSGGSPGFCFSKTALATSFSNQTTRDEFRASQTRKIRGLGASPLFFSPLLSKPLI